MGPLLFGLVLARVTAGLLLLADDVLKARADTGAHLRSGPVMAGNLHYVASTVAWFIAMRHIPLGQAAVTYSMLSLVGLITIGVLAFDETFGLREAAGPACALVATAPIFRG